MKKLKYSQGITLIALIITIILMLILAGVVISLTLGENGLFSTAKYAVQKNSEETAREKLEIVLADLQAKKYTDETYNERKYINTEINKNGMTVSGNIVLVDDWKFEIDRSSLQITSSLGKGELATINITTTYVGTSSFTTKVLSSYKEDEIEQYKYALDEEEIVSSDKEYTVEKELEPESTHTMQVIAIYKDGTTLESNILTIKTEPRTYLMKDGKLLIDSGIIKNATLTEDTESGCLKLKVGPVGSRGGYILSYDLAQYKKLKLDAEVTSVTGTSFGFGFGIMDKDEDPFTTKKDEFDLATVLEVGETSKARDTYSLNAEDINEICWIEIAKGSSGSITTGIEVNIYSLWLEK